MVRRGGRGCADFRCIDAGNSGTFNFTIRRPKSTRAADLSEKPPGTQARWLLPTGCATESRSPAAAIAANTEYNPKHQPNRQRYRAGRLSFERSSTASGRASLQTPRLTEQTIIVNKEVWKVYKNDKDPSSAGTRSTLPSCTSCVYAMWRLPRAPSSYTLIMACASAPGAPLRSPFTLNSLATRPDTFRRRGLLRPAATEPLSRTASSALGGQMVVERILEELGRLFTRRGTVSHLAIISCAMHASRSLLGFGSAPQPGVSGAVISEIPERMIGGSLRSIL